MPVCQMNDLNKATVADLQGKLAAIDAREKQELDQLQEQVREKYRKTKGFLKGTIAFYEDLDSDETQEDTSLEEEAPSISEPSANGAQKPVGEKKRQRVPRGFYAKETTLFAVAVSRFFHPKELERHLKKRLRELYPDDQHLKLSTKSMDRNLSKLIDGGHLALAVYDDSANYQFYGLPKYVAYHTFGSDFVPEEAGPRGRDLRGVKNPVPMFQPHAQPAPH